MSKLQLHALLHLGDLMHYLKFSCNETFLKVYHHSIN
uniref:Uncharacterized protein n=1 Tax=Rhizophora mucronata TaxID=61149 RepID=A0A2P2NWQ6_RHIMU